MLRGVLVMQGEIAEAIVGQVRAKLPAEQATGLESALPREMRLSTLG